MKNSTCYKGTGKMQVKGILWHSTGANNPNLCRYVQPHESDANYNELIAVLGKNKYNNDWNHIKRDAGLNAWIGKLADGSVTTVQTMPWDYKPWGCGKGKNGSCNNNFIQFEICEDNLKDKDYFNKVYKEACELTAYLCDMYKIDPCGSVMYNGVSVPTILCHADSYKLGLGNNHGDVLHWFKKHGKTMEDVRNDVKKLMKAPDPVVADKIDTVKEVQKWLNVTYKSGLAVDGSYGKKTKAALVKALQVCLGFTGKDVDGSYGSKTNAAVKKNNLKRGDKNEMVKVLQALLVCNGYPAAYVDGSFGACTEKVVIQFQAKKKLKQDGVAGSGTFKALCK